MNIEKTYDELKGFLLSKSMRRVHSLHGKDFTEKEWKKFWIKSLRPALDRVECFAYMCNEDLFDKNLAHDIADHFFLSLWDADIVQTVIKQKRENDPEYLQSFEEFVEFLREEKKNDVDEVSLRGWGINNNDEGEKK